MTEVDESLRVLAIVGDELTRDVLQRLGDAQVRVELIDDLGDGLSRAQEWQPELALVEVTLGQGAGLALIHHLRAMVRDVVVIALAAPKGLESAAHAMALGASSLMVLPLEGDEVLSALAQVRTTRAEKRRRAELERGVILQARLAGWFTKIVAAASSDGSAAGAAIASVFGEATRSKSVVLYRRSPFGEDTLERCAALGDASPGPSTASEKEVLAYAAGAGLFPLALASGDLREGFVLLSGRPESLQSLAALEDSVFLLVAQAATTLGLLREQERAGGAASLKDPDSSAYSFAYYVDVAGREIDRAKRYKRRFAILTVSVEDGAIQAAGGIAEIADQVLGAVTETAMVARVDEMEFQILLPELDGLGAHAARRRIVARLAPRVGASSVRVGAACFPHDGSDLGQLLRMARRRADLFSRLGAIGRDGFESLGALLGRLEGEVQEKHRALTLQPLEINLPDAIALAATMVAEGLRGGAVAVTVAQPGDLGLSAAVRGAIPPGRDNAVLHAIETKSSDIEAMSVLAEHGAYALVGRNEGGIIRGIHSCDPFIAEHVAEEIGRTGGARIFA